MKHKRDGSSGKITPLYTAEIIHSLISSEACDHIASKALTIVSFTLCLLLENAILTQNLLTESAERKHEKIITS